MVVRPTKCHIKVTAPLFLLSPFLSLSYALLCGILCTIHVGSIPEYRDNRPKPRIAVQEKKNVQCAYQIVKCFYSSVISFDQSIIPSLCLKIDQPCRNRIHQLLCKFYLGLSQKCASMPGQKSENCLHATFPFIKSFHITREINCYVITRI